jgi:hypothetical protein
MKKMLLLATLVISSGALAEGPATGGQAPKPKKADGVVCHTVDETGSRLGGKRVCMTREQWEVARRDARDATEHAQVRQANMQGN